MKINHIFVIGVIAGILMVSPVVVHSFTIEPIGDPVLGGSWTQNWSINANDTGFGFAEAFIFNVDGDPTDFRFPAGDNFSVGGWTANIYNTGYMVMHGDATTYDLMYRGHYTGNYISQNFYLDYLFFDQCDNFIFGHRFQWIGFGTGYGWYHIPDYNCHPYDHWYCQRRCRVPEPTTILLLGAGLIGLGILGRKKFKKD